MVFLIEKFMIVLICSLLVVAVSETDALRAEETETPEAAPEVSTPAAEDNPVSGDKPVSEDPASSPLDESVLAQPQNAVESKTETPAIDDKKEISPTKKIQKFKKSEQVAPEDPANNVQGAPQVVIPEGSEISQGQRILIEGKGFSLKPPAGWIIQRDVPRVSLSLVAPVPEGQYPSNINVNRFSGSKIINQDTAEKFAEKIVKDFPATSPTIEAYTLRNSQPIDLADGRKALLFYTDFLGSGRKMMQAHVLASSETNHYLITYTDLAENFETNAEGVQSPVFNIAWESLASLELDSPNPVPSQELAWILGVVGALLITWFLVSFIRNRRAAAEYRQFSDRGHQPGDHDELISSLAQVGVGQKVSLEPTLMSLPKSDSGTISPELSDPLSDDAAPVRGKKIKVAKRGHKAVDDKKWEEISGKASEVSSIEFSQDKFKREI